MIPIPKKIQAMENLRTVKNGIKYGNLPGTSMAAPLVSGSAAVLWSVAPELSAEEVKETLISTAGTSKINLSGRT